MKTSLHSVDPSTPEPDIIARAAEVLRHGGLVAFPTETVYGLGANALDAEAVQRIFEAKGRPAANPVIVHVASSQDAQMLVTAWPEMAARLAERFWPGPLTLILPRSEAIPDIITACGPTVAVRVPAHPVALALIRTAGIPIAAPSANRSTQLSPTLARHVLRGLDGRIDMLLDGGPTADGLESTVLDVSVSPPRLLRPGVVSPSEIEAVIGPIEHLSIMAAGHVVRSPGMMSRHYAPRTPLELVEGGRDRVEELALAGQRVAWLTIGSEMMDGVKCLKMPDAPAAYAAVLYATLHAVDEEGLDRIIVELPPKTEEWLAVRDRLQRASK